MEASQEIVLGAIHTTIHSYLLSENLDILERNWTTQYCAIDDIAPHAGLREQEPGFEELRSSIVQSGMKYPIVLLENTFANYVGCCTNVTPELILPFDIEKTYIAASGNQRLVIAKELGFTHIETILTPDLNWAFSVLLEIRENLP